MDSTHAITPLLREVEDGRDGAMDRLMAKVYTDLEGIARAHLNRYFIGGASSITLEPAALVNESFLRLIKQRTKYDNRGHFFAVATRIMLRVLIDYRREKNAAKRGGADTRITFPLNEQEIQGNEKSLTEVIEIEELVNALEKLETLNPRKADVVKMKVVWGLKTGEIAESLGLSTKTVERDWRFAKAWLADQIGLPAPLTEMKEFS